MSTCEDDVHVRMELWPWSVLYLACRRRDTCRRGSHVKRRRLSNSLKCEAENGLLYGNMTVLAEKEGNKSCIPLKRH